MDAMLYYILLICGTVFVAALPVYLAIKILRGLTKVVRKPLTKPKKRVSVKNR